MKRSTVILAVVAATACAALAQVSASTSAQTEARRKPRPTTTTSTTITTTTTAPATTTTVPTGCGPPITITVGGTYSGCYESTNSNTPAVTIQTTAPVTLSHATLRHKGRGVQAVGRTNLTVVDSTFTALDPGPTPVEQRDVYAYQAASIVLEHNRLVGGHGFLIAGDGAATPIDTFRVSYNDFVNVGRYNQIGPSAFAGALHTDTIYAPNGGTADWNRVVDVYGQSVIEDAFGIYRADGAAGHPILFRHNLVDGVYPYTGDGAGFTGAAFDLADSGGSYLEGDGNVAVNYTNTGMAMPSGDHVFHANSVAVYDGKAGIDDAGPRVSSSFGNALDTWQNPDYPTRSADSAITNSTGAQWRWTGTAWERSDAYLPNCVGCAGNSTVSPVDAAAEQNAVDGWEAARLAAGVTVGPR